MSSHACQIHIKKEVLKFSSAHMTVFPDKTKEALHGHNYTTDVTISIKDTSLERLVSFAYFKQLLEQICSEWDSRVLIARNCPFLKMVKDSEHEIEFFLCGKRYVFPREDVALLEIENVSVECLAELFVARLIDRLKDGLIGKVITGLQVRIEETAGQGATVTWHLAEESQ